MNPSKNRIITFVDMLSDDQTRIILGLLFSVPIGYGFRYIRQVDMRELYSIIAGTLLQYYVYGSSIALVFALHALVYLLAYLNIKNLGFVVTFLSMGLLSIYHIYRLVVDYGGWTMDVSTIIMMNVCKYSEFAYALQDGKTDEAKLTSEQK